MLSSNSFIVLFCILIYMYILLFGWLGIFVYVYITIFIDPGMNGCAKNVTYPASVQLQMMHI